MAPAWCMVPRCRCPVVPAPAGSPPLAGSSPLVACHASGGCRYGHLWNPPPPYRIERPKVRMVGAGSPASPACWLLCLQVHDHVPDCPHPAAGHPAISRRFCTIRSTGASSCISIWTPQTLKCQLWALQSAPTFGVGAAGRGMRCACGWDVLGGVLGGSAAVNPL